MIEFYGLPWWNWCLQGVGVSLSYAGAVLNARLDIRGFRIWLISNVALFVLHAFSGLWLLCALDAAYFRINLMGLRQWRRKDQTPAPGVDPAG
jgi:hypothetical protein